MSLIKCPDCGQTVSDRTKTCLKCGRPIANTVEPAAVPSVPVQTIEKTSKKLKGWLAICYASFFLSLFVMFIAGGMESLAVAVMGLFVFLGSAAGIIWVKFKIWWEHE